jgi:hypothetical protein
MVPDLALGVAGLLVFGAASLAYPFGWDSGVTFYVGREWLLRGAIPYKDLFDHKSPGIYVVQAVCVALFGDGMFGIRIAELACVAVLGVLCAVLVAPPRRRPEPGVRGVAVLAACFFYFAFFDFWNTAQCEIWTVTLIVGALVAVERSRSVRGAAIGSGLLVGAALLMKPPSAILALLVVILLARRAWLCQPRPSRVDAALGLHAAGAIALPAATVAYFWAHGALADMLDILVRANWFYLHRDPPEMVADRVLGRLTGTWRDFSPSAPFVLVAATGASTWAALRGTRAWRKYAVAAALLAACLGSILLQRKLYVYHWGVVVGPLTVAAAALSADAAAALRSAGAGRRAWAGPLAFAAALLLTFSGSGGTFKDWVWTDVDTARWLAGGLDREQFAARFSEYYFRYRYRDREEVGLWLRDHASPDDTVLVRGVAAEIYAVSRMHAPSDRFFWTPWLTLPSRAYRRDEWLREDREAIERDPPRFVVAVAAVASGPDSIAWFAPLGYVERTRIHGFVVLERETRGAAVSAPLAPGS